MGNWETEIFNYFDHPVTNAFTECLNGLTRVYELSGRGYSFEALRAKVLFTYGAHKKLREKPKYERLDASDRYDRMAFFTLSTFDQPREKDKV